MAYDLNASVTLARLPTAAAFTERLAANRVQLPNLVDILALGGFTAATLDGEPTGFEVSHRTITAEDRDRYRKKLEKRNKPPDQYLEILMSSDLDFMISCSARDPRAVRTARLVAETLAVMAHGWFSDPQQGETRSYPSRA